MSANIPPCYGIIPARYDSSRFPGKPLADILGKPMFWHVYTRAARCPGMTRVVLATDDQRILDEANRLGVDAVMTARDHASGTDRVLEAARMVGVPDEAVVVNIQGDEPCLDPGMLSALIAPFGEAGTCCASLMSPMTAAEAASPDRVKVVVDSRGDAMYFSRAPIPYCRDGEGEYFLHIGLYAFRMETLKRFSSLGRGRLEALEKLEQLRLLENGIPIRMVETEHKCHGVDRPEDLAAVTTLLEHE